MDFFFIDRVGRAIERQQNETAFMKRWKAGRRGFFHSTLQSLRNHHPSVSIMLRHPKWGHKAATGGCPTRSSAWSLKPRVQRLRQIAMRCEKFTARWNPARTTADRTAAHRKSDQRPDDLCAVALCKRVRAASHGLSVGR